MTLDEFVKAKVSGTPTPASDSSGAGQSNSGNSGSGSSGGGVTLTDFVRSKVTGQPYTTPAQEPVILSPAEQLANAATNNTNIDAMKAKYGQQSQAPKLSPNLASQALVSTDNYLPPNIMGMSKELQSVADAFLDNQIAKTNPRSSVTTDTVISTRSQIKDINDKIRDLEQAESAAAMSGWDASEYVAQRQQLEAKRDYLNGQLNRYESMLQPEYNKVNEDITSLTIKMVNSTDPAEKASLYSQIEELNARQDELMKGLNVEVKPVVEWDGRAELLAEYKRLSKRFYTVGLSDADKQKMDETHTKLVEGDIAHGNGERSYTFMDRAMNVGAGAAQNIGSSIVNAAGNLFDAYSRGLSHQYTLGTALTDQAAGIDPMSRIAMQSEYVQSDEHQATMDQIYGVADRLGDDATESLEIAKRGLGTLGQAGVDLAENALEMGFDAGVAAVTNGSSLASMFVRVYGGATREARLEGANPEEAAMYGLAKGGIEVATEKLFDGVAKVYGAGAADEVVEELVRKLAQTNTGRTVLRVIINAPGEGVEELISEALDPVAKTLYSDKSLGELYGEQSGADYLYSFMIGTAMGILGGGTNIVTGGNAAANAELAARDVELASGTETNTTTEAPAQQTTTVEQPTAPTVTNSVTDVSDTLLDILQNSRNAETGQITQAGIAQIQNNPALLALFNETAGTEVTEQKSGVNRDAIRNNADAVVHALTATESIEAEAESPVENVSEEAPAVNAPAEATEENAPAVNNQTEKTAEPVTEASENAPTEKIEEAAPEVREEEAEPAKTEDTEEPAQEKPKKELTKAQKKVADILSKGESLTDAEITKLLRNNSSIRAIESFMGGQLPTNQAEQIKLVRELARDIASQDAPDAYLVQKMAQDAKVRSRESELQYKVEQLEEQLKAKELEIDAEIRMAEARGDIAKKEALQKQRENLRAKQKERVAKVKQAMREQFDKRMANKKERAAVRKTIKDIDGYIKALTDMGSKPTNGKYIPQSLMGSVKEAIQTITMERAGNIDLATEQKLADLAEKIRNAETIDETDELLEKWERIVKGDERMQAKFDKVLNAVQEMRQMNKDSNDVRPDILADYVNSIAEKLGDTPFYQMNSEQLGELKNALKAIKTTVESTVNTKLLGQIKTAYEAAIELRNEAANARTFAESRGNVAGDIARAGASRFELAWNRPEVVFNLLGGRHVDSAFNALYHALDQAYMDKSGMTVQGREYFNDLLENTKGIRSLRGKVTVDGIVNSNGKAIEMSRGMRLYLRMLLENSDSARSIALGGLSIPERTAYYLGVNDNGFGTTMSRSVGTSEELNTLRHDYRKLAEEYQQLDAQTERGLDWQTNIDDVVTKMDSIEARINQILEENGQSVEDMKAAIDADLTAYEREWLDKAREFFDWAGEEVDKANLAEYGFAKAIVENYVPIFRDANFRNSSIENIVREMSIRNWGSMKARSNFATQPIMLMDLFDVCDSYLQKASTYAKMMPTLNEFQRIWNTTEATDNASGNIESLRNTIREKLGKAGVKYIENLIQDVQGGRHQTILGLDVSGLSQALNRARGNLAKASLTLNPGVALGQTASYISAGAKIPGKYLLKALATPESKNSIMERINENTLVLKDRMSGSGSVIKADANIVDRAYNKMNWLTGWIQGMDTRTVVKLYQACEFYVEDSLGLARGTEEFNQAVTDTWIEVLETTQPEYSPMQRPDILRSPDTLVKSMTMFMTQRIQNYNTMFNATANLEQAVHDMNEAKKSGDAETIANAKEALKTRNTEFARSMSSVIMSNAAYVVIRNLADGLMHRWDKWRDKETGEITAEAVAKRLAWMFGETMAGCVPLGNIAFTLLESSITGDKYYGLSVSGINNISTALEDIVNAGQAIFGDADGEKTLAKAYKAAKSVADMLGISATNAEKLVKSVMDWYGEIRNIVENDAVLGEYYEFSTKQNKNRLWNALQDDDYEKAERVMNSMGDNAEENAKAVIKGHYQAGDISTNEVADMLAGIGIEDSDKQANTWEEKEEYKKFTEDNPGTSLNETAYKSYEASDNKPDRETFDRVVGDVTSETGKAYGNVSQTELYDYLKADDTITEEEKGKIWDTWFPDAAKSYSGMLTYEAVQDAKADATGEYDSKGDNAILHMLLDSDYDDAGKDEAMGFAGKGIRDDYSVLRNEGYPADDVIGWLLGIDAMGTGKSLNNGSISQPEMKAFYLENPNLEHVIEALWNSQKYKNGTEAGLWENNKP